MRTSKEAAVERISPAYEQLFEMIVHGRLRQEGLLIEVGGRSGLRGRLAVAPLDRERMEELYALAGAIERHSFPFPD